MIQAVTETPLKTEFIVCDTPISMPVIWNSTMNTIAAQTHTTQPTRKRGPGTRFEEVVAVGAEHDAGQRREDPRVVPARDQLETGHERDRAAERDEDAAAGGDAEARRDGKERRAARHDQAAAREQSAWPERVGEDAGWNLHRRIDPVVGRGKDAERGKPTYVTLLGVQAARQMAADLHREALDALEGCGEKARRLRELADFIVLRKF